MSDVERNYYEDLEHGFHPSAPFIPAGIADGDHYYYRMPLRTVDTHGYGRALAGGYIPTNIIGGDARPAAGLQLFLGGKPQEHVQPYSPLSGWYQQNLIANVTLDADAHENILYQIAHAKTGDNKVHLEVVNGTRADGDGDSITYDFEDFILSFESYHTARVMTDGMWLRVKLTNLSMPHPQILNTDGVMNVPGMFLPKPVFGVSKVEGAVRREPPFGRFDEWLYSFSAVVRIIEDPAEIEKWIIEEDLI